MLVYLIVNKVNGKGYVGQTTRDVQLRWRQHCLLGGGCRALRNALKKYGVDAFEISVVATVQTQEELNRLERLTIEALKTRAPHGYNLNEGGGAKGKMHEQTKRIMREIALKPERLAAFRAMRLRPDVRAKQSVYAKKNGAASAANMQSGRTPEVERMRREASARTWGTAEVRQAQSVRQKEIQARPEVKAKKAAGLAADWASLTDDERKARGAAISAGTTGVKKIIDYSPEAKAARNEVAKRRWASPTMQANHAASMAKLLADPSFLKKRGKAIAAALSEKGPEFFEKRAAKHAATWAKIAAVKTHCKHGHELTEENTFLAAGKKRCLACRTLVVQRFREKRDGARA